MEKAASSTDNFKKKRYRVYYTVLFVVFGILIALSTSIVSYRLDTTNIQKKLHQNASAEFAKKKQELHTYTDGLEDFLSALEKSISLTEYILNPTTENHRIILDQMLVMASTDQTIMQLRYLDANGMERLRIDRDLQHPRPTITQERFLQNKSHRYYFTESAKLKPNEYWFSRLDLNMENSIIEVPHKPVLRLATPVYIEEQFHGILILNIHAANFLNHFIASNYFNISLIDRDGFYLVDYHPERSWSRYLNTGITLQNVLPVHADSILATNNPAGIEQHGKLFSASLASLLQKDEALIVFEAKDFILKSMKDERQNAAQLITLIIILLSLPLSLFISRVPARLYQKISRQNVILTEYFKLIDTNIITCTTDIHGNFLAVSSAFATVSGYSKEELAAETYYLLMHPDEKATVYENILHTIAGGQTWHGEIYHRNKSGEAFWTEASIYPKQNNKGDIVECSFIHQNITNRKKIEELSVTDELTGLYNRRFFNSTIKRELNRAQRDEKLLTFAIMDVDYFKQYNDHYGHLKGDEVLATIGQTLKRMLGRGSDSCFRLGGEEFGVIIVDMQPAEALHFVESIRLSIQRIGIEHHWSEVADVVTISGGLLSVTPGPGVTVDAVFRTADQALYNAKDLGRNQVVPAILDAEV